MIVLWIAALVVFILIETFSMGLVSVWFALGAAAALIAAVCDAGVWAQVWTFLIASVAALAATRPFVRSVSRKKLTPTNADRVLRSVGRVTETVDNAAPSGSVYVDGKTWTARSADSSVIAAGCEVEIERIEGVKLIVREKRE